jgi:hypothetical protein
VNPASAEDGSDLRPRVLPKQLLAGAAADVRVAGDLGSGGEQGDNLVVGAPARGVAERLRAPGLVSEAQDRGDGLVTAVSAHVPDERARCGAGDLSFLRSSELCRSGMSSYRRACSPDWMTLPKMGRNAC